MATAIDVLRSQIDDGAFGDEFDGCEPLDVGDGFAVLVCELSVAICSDAIGGTVMIPRSVLTTALAYTEEQ